MPSLIDNLPESLYKMVDVGNKPATLRRAIAQGRITVGAHAFELIKTNKLPKGDVLRLAEIAGIIAAKKAYELIPLCHPLGVEHVSVHLELIAATNSVMAYCSAATVSKTGVEMEALAGVNAALLTIYDLVKMVEPALTISDIRLLVKQGGKSGLWQHPDGIPAALSQGLAPATKPSLANARVAVVTMSDRGAAKKYVDKSGPLLKAACQDLGAEICDYTILPDDQQQLIQHIRSLMATDPPQLIITTGGTGLGPRDVTPEAFTKICDRMIPGLGELLRHDGARHYTRFAWLSRCVAGLIDKTLLIALPGKPSAVAEALEILTDLLPHAIHIASGGGHD